MFPLFESIRLLNGSIQNKGYHEERFQKSYAEYFSSIPPFGLFEDLIIPIDFKEGLVKLRIAYGKKGKETSFEKYSGSKPKTLKILEVASLNYQLKFNDRSELDVLFSQRQNCDDVLIVTDGLVTDTTYTNILFYDGDIWLTPDKPLLRGTQRQLLIDQGIVTTKRIHLDDIFEFKGFQVVNAMLPFDPLTLQPIESIKGH